MITDYSSLQDELTEYLHRTDLGAKLPTFIQICEAKLANNIRSKKLIVTATLTALAGESVVALPADFGVLKSVSMATSPYNPLALVSDNEFRVRKQTVVSDTPINYIIEGDTISVWPIPADGFSLTAIYYQHLPALSTINPTNWVLDRYPYIYLYGALLAASVFTNDPDQAQFYQTNFDGALKDMWTNHGLEQYSGAPLMCTSDYIV